MVALKAEQLQHQIPVQTEAQIKARLMAAQPGYEYIMLINITGETIEQLRPHLDLAAANTELISLGRKVHRGQARSK
jgi:hypothetical protein